MKEHGKILKGKHSLSIGDYAGAIYTLQLALLDGISSENKLLAAGSLLSRSDYEDVVTERTIANLCGYPLCVNPLPSDRPKKGRYRISLKEHRVYDLTETFLYCSSGCLLHSRAFAQTLNAERCTDLNHEKVSRVLSLFREGGTEEEEKEVLGVRELKILEKLDVNDKGDVSVQDWMGPSDAIEGYVPQKEQKKPSFSRSKKSGEDSKSIVTESVSKEKRKKNSATNKQKDAIGNSIDFTSEIIIGQQFINPSASPRDVSSLKEDQAAGIKSDLKKMPLKSCLKSSKVKSTGSTVTWTDEKNEVILHSESNPQMVETTFGDIQLWDYQKQEVELEHDQDGNEGGIHVGNGVPSSSHFASAEVCAAALREAAEAVASGKCEAADAVSQAGIVILPPYHAVGEEQLQEVREVLPAYDHLRRQNISSALHSDVFHSDNSWFDSPPEGFSLRLSQFATMWMALFGWITASSLAYIYGREESATDEFLLVNGREYPRKVVVGDGLSSEIKHTLAGCLSRSLPGLTTCLRLGTPISTLEQALGRLLDTMSFVDPLPPFRTKQWHVIILLFLEALSVRRILSLASPITNRAVLIHKVLEAAEVSIEEYDLMKDLIIPLGRDPEFCAQSGG